jgi:hypothetical protein
LALEDSEKAKPRSFAGYAFDAVKQATHEHPPLESAAIAAASLALGLLANRFHASPAVEHFFPKGAALLGETTEDLLRAHAASEGLPKFLTNMHSGKTFHIFHQDHVAATFVGPLDKVTESFPNSKLSEFAKPILAQNADTVASIFHKHMNSPEWNALNRARAEAHKIAQEAFEAVPLLPKGTPFPGDKDELRALRLKLFGVDGLGKIDAWDAANANLDVLYAKSAAPFRLPVLQRAFDELSDTFSLPRARVYIEKSMTAAGTHTPGTNEVFVHPSTLETENGAGLANTSAHELTHLEGDTLILRRAADNLGIGIKANENQLELLKRSYEREFGLPATDEFVSKVLGVRNGRILRPDESERAEQLLKSYLEDRPRNREFIASEIEFGAISTLRQQLKSNSAWDVLSQYHGEHLTPESGIQITREEDNIKRFVRLQNPEIDRVVKTLSLDEDGKLVSWPPETDRTNRRNLRAFLYLRQKELRRFLDRSTPGYYATLHEQEAHAAGAAVEQAFRNLVP